MFEFQAVFSNYVKILWNKAKSYGLCSKVNIKHMKIFIFILKIIKYLNIDDRKKYFDELEEFYSNNEKYKGYYKIIKYYKKNWNNNPYINYSEISEKDYFFMTNNYLENLHYLLN